MEKSTPLFLTITTAFKGIPEKRVAPCVWSPIYRNSSPLDPLSSPSGTSSSSSSSGGGGVINAPRFVPLSFGPWWFNAVGVLRVYANLRFPCFAFPFERMFRSVKGFRGDWVGAVDSTRKKVSRNWQSVLVFGKIGSLVSGA